MITDQCTFCDYKKFHCLKRWTMFAEEQLIRTLIQKHFQFKLNLQDETFSSPRYPT